jgi:hypothetical protein
MEPEISNLTLEKLHELEPLSKETLMFCQGYHLDDIKSIVQFYHLNGSLINQMKYIHPDQTKPGTELRKVYQKYNLLIQPYAIPLNNRKDILLVSLAELMHRENLPGWLMERCSDNGLNNLNSILNYYRTEKDFLRLRLCGSKMNKLLTELSQRFNDLEIIPVIDPMEEVFNSVLKLKESLSATQALAFDNFIKIKTEKLSYRKLQCLQKLMNCGLGKPDLRAILFFDDDQISSIFRIDIFTTAELIKLKNQLKEFVDLISVRRMDENLYLNLMNIVLPKTASLNYDQKVLVSGFNFSKGFPIFKTIDFLIENQLIWHKMDSIIFRNNTEFCRDVCLHNTEEIAAELSKTKSFVSDRSSNLFFKLDNAFSFLKYVDRSVFNLYNFNESDDLIFVDDKLVNKINNTEGTNFTAQFITKIFSIIYSDSYQLIGRDVHHPLSRGNGWTDSYLVSLRQGKKLDIYDFVEEIAYLLSKKVIKTYTFSLEDKLKSYTNVGDSPDKDLLDITKFILMNECVLKLDKNYKSRIKKNTSISIKEALYERLKDYNQSMDIEQICESMYVKYQYQKSEENRNILIKYLDKNPLLMGYINVGTGCREWMEKIVF